MHFITTTIHTQLLAKANANNAKSMKAYMLNQFEFLGVKTPDRRAISKTVFKQNIVNTSHELSTLVKELWAFNQREWQYIAIECLAYYKKLWQPQTISLIQYLLTTKSWWDTVDAIASYILSDYFKKFPELIITTEAWNTSNNMWLQRSSIMFQKAWKKQTNIQLLSQYILRHACSKEFFIQKAIGWALREYSKTNPKWVLNFIEQHKSLLSTLSYKEGIRNINQKATT
jgi:3-methyladenine DNA glycosylase AlkD